MTDDSTPADDADEFIAAATAEETEALKAEVAELREKVLRVAADAENAKRRAEREANDGRAYAIQKFARDLLDASDNLFRAVQHAPRDVADPAVKNFVMGVEMSEKALQTAFERNGLKRVEPKRGDKFDPHLHQAMMEQDAEGVPPGGVIQVLQSGYELGGRIVRPAMVAVTPKSAAGAAPEAGAAAQPPAGDGANPYAQGGPDATGSNVNAKA